MLYSNNEVGIRQPQEWVGLTSARYTSDGYKVSLRHRYIGEGVIDAAWTSGVDVDNNKVDSVSYVDLTVNRSFDIDGINIDLFVSVDNLFDKEPPVFTINSATKPGEFGAANTRHDLIGRYFRAGIKFEF